MEHQQFIDTIANLVIKYACQYGIKVHSPIIAQAINESNWGESKLASYFNFFGLKCGTKWTGKRITLKTSEEYVSGVLTEIYDEFRVFDDFDSGVKGYFDFISTKRYENLKGITDPQKYLEQIKNDKYSTSSKYVENVMRIVDQYGLEKYDIKETSDARTKVVELAKSWIGKNEEDGSFKEIIDIYNSYSGKFPRGTKMKYNWAWCACTWSALAIKLGYTDIMPIEISCFYLIKKAKEMNCWQESDDYVPKPGDAVLYDWDDNGLGDNTGTPDHVGTVEKVDVNKITVIEGNYSNSVKRREIDVNGKFIRGFITPNYESKCTVIETKTKESKKANEYAHAFDSSLAGEYTTTSDLHMRNGAGSIKKSMVILPKGTKCMCYGYYSLESGTQKKWLYIVADVDGIEYTGFSSMNYLIR